MSDLFELKRNPNIIEIPDNATNGDIFQKIYKDVWDYKCEYTIDVFMESCIARFSLDWWNAPYKKGEYRMNDIRPCGNNEKWCESCVSKGKCNYTKKQDIIAEFEEIKTEINAKERVELSTKEMWYNFALADVTHIIDNHISELKGENNG